MNQKDLCKEASWKLLKSIEHRKNVFQDSCISFSDYVASKFKWKLPSIFEEKGLTLFQEEEK